MYLIAYDRRHECACYCKLGISLFQFSDTEAHIDIHEATTMEITIVLSFFILDLIALPRA